MKTLKEGLKVQLSELRKITNKDGEEQKSDDISTDESDDGSDDLSSDSSDDN